MVEIFEEGGMSHEDAELVIHTMAKYKDFFVDIMMTQGEYSLLYRTFASGLVVVVLTHHLLHKELELQVPEDDHVRESFNEGA